MTTRYRYRWDRDAPGVMGSTTDAGVATTLARAGYYVTAEVL